MLGIYAFIIGAAVGSFLNVLADRVPDGRSPVLPRSRCESCQRTVASYDMIPVLSYLLLRGKCRTCKAEIPFRVVLIETATGAIFLGVFLLHGFGLGSIVISACLALLLLISIIDLERGLILDVMVFPSIVLLLVLAPFWPDIGFPRTFLGDDTLVGSLANSSLAGFGAFLAFLAVAVINPAGMGGGDIKFAAVLGLMLGFPGILMAIWISVIGGGLIAVCLIVARKKSRKDVMPFGPFMAIGAAVVLISGSGIVNLYQDLAAAVSFT